MIEIVPVTPCLGAEIHGLDLAEPASPEQVQAIRRALDEHLVVFFPDQKLSPEQQIDFGRKFGGLTTEHPAYLKTLDDHPEVVVLDGQRGGKADLWHTDITWYERPPMGAILFAKVMPACGGDTLWSNLEAAYDGLSERMKRGLDDAIAVHDLSLTVQNIMRERSSSTQAPAGEGANLTGVFPSARHPLVRTSTRTGHKSLFVNPTFTSHIADMTLKESDGLLRFLYEHMVQPEYTVRHRWSQGDVGFWDNTRTMHYAVADYGGEERVIHRVTVEGERPV